MNAASVFFGSRLDNDTVNHNGMQYLKDLSFISSYFHDL